MARLLIALSFILVLASCKKDEALSVVYPEVYFPAYPGSIWFYSNGDVSKVHTSYQAHSYQASISSTEYSGTKLVPYMDHEYVYGYQITQNSNAYPLKKLLTESVQKAWVIDTTGTKSIYRETIAVLDSFNITFSASENYEDSTYKNVVVVVEFSEGLSAAAWNRKEYYAKNVGLIQVEVNNPYDTIGSIIQKKLVGYSINN